MLIPNIGLIEFLGINYVDKCLYAQKMEKTELTGLLSDYSSQILNLDLWSDLACLFDFIVHWQ